jgi:hypothetical protein
MTLGIANVNRRLNVTIFDKQALFSPELKPLHRYVLRRDLDHIGDNPGGVVVSIGYNPSMANAYINDPTITTECNLCRAWNKYTFIKVNLFAGIATDPDDLEKMDDPIGPENDRIIKLAAIYAQNKNGMILATWGTPKGRENTKRRFYERERQVLEMGLTLWVIRLTKNGHPAHPLYSPATTQAFLWDYKKLL